LLLLLLGLAVVAGSLVLYHHERKKLETLIQFKSLAASQAVQITNLTAEIDRLNASQQVSVKAVVSLNTQKEQLTQRARTRQAAVSVSVAKVVASDLPDVQKSEQTSTVYVQSLWQAYCEAQPVLCTP
jgi:hypothetical protein